VSDFTKSLAAWLPIPAKTQKQGSSELQREVSQLFHELRLPVLRYLLSLGLPLHESEDVAQETFLALFQHLAAGKPRDNLRGWVFRVAHNLALKQYRHDRRDSLLDSTAELHHDPKPNPEHWLAAKRKHDRLAAVVDALRERDRQCLHLRVEGLTYREIAEVLEMSLGAVSQSLTRSLAKLSQVIER
jgi:RNA polymerase sigma-70 factor, ECF subfamily